MSMSVSQSSAALITDQCSQDQCVTENKMSTSGGKSYTDTGKNSDTSGYPIRTNNAQSVDSVTLQGKEWTGQFTWQLGKYHRTMSTDSSFEFKGVAAASALFQSSSNGFLGISPYKPTDTLTGAKENLLVQLQSKNHITNNMVSFYLDDNSSVIKWGSYDAECLRNGPNSMTWYAPANNDVTSWALKADRFGFGRADVAMLEKSMLIVPEVPYIYLGSSTFD